MHHDGNILIGGGTLRLALVAGGYNIIYISTFVRRGDATADGGIEAIHRTVVGQTANQIQCRGQCAVNAGEVNVLDGVSSANLLLDRGYRELHRRVHLDGAGDRDRLTGWIALVARGLDGVLESTRLRRCAGDCLCRGIECHADGQNTRRLADGSVLNVEDNRRQCRAGTNVLVLVAGIAREDKHHVGIHPDGRYGCVITVVSVDTGHRHLVGAGRSSAECGVGVVRGQISNWIPRISLCTVGHQRGRAGSADAVVIHRHIGQLVIADVHRTGLRIAPFVIDDFHLVGTRNRGRIARGRSRRDGCAVQSPHITESAALHKRTSVRCGRQRGLLLARA